ncbi:MAG: zinc ribbon domain-containing protein [Lachnospiraceae bacterium]|nr:zinc ribbon domain-containing protein [Lachnospiraceae bacterium]
MNLKSITCPSCNAPIKMKPTTDTFVCPYCGTHISNEVDHFTMVFNKFSNAVDKGSALISKKIDEKEKERERAEQIRREEAERAEQIRQELAKKMRRRMPFFIGAGAILFLILIIIIGIDNRRTKKAIEAGGIPVPYSAEEYKNVYYKDAQAELETLGYTNITVEPIFDLVTGWLISDGSIERVSINGSTDFTKGKIFPNDAAIRISYHTFESNKDTPKPESTDTIITPEPTIDTTPEPISSFQPTNTPSASISTESDVVCEYAYVAQFRNSEYPDDTALNYDMYYLFDTSKNKIYTFISTSPEWVDVGSYTGTINGQSFFIEAKIDDYVLYISGSEDNIDISDEYGYVGYMERTDSKKAESLINLP